MQLAFFLADIYCLLKELITKPVEVQDERTYFECLHLLLKYGPLYKFSAFYLRDDFPFFHKLCDDLKSSDKNLQVYILKILTEFCKQVIDILFYICNFIYELFVDMQRLSCGLLQIRRRTLPHNRTVILQNLL